MFVIVQKLISQHDEMQSEKEELLALLETKEQLSEATAVDMERRQVSDEIADDSSICGIL